MKKYFILLFLLSAFSQYAFGQDPSFSQAYLNQIYLNPAFTGANEGMRIHGAYKRQYNGVQGGFNTQLFDVDLAEPCYNIGLGAMAYNDVEGEGRLRTSKMGFSGAWNTVVKKQKLDFSAGGAISLIQKSIDWNKLEFSNQFDPVLGKIYQSGVKPNATSIASVVDIDFGLMGKYLQQVDAYHYALINFGVGVHHINKPKEAFVSNARMPTRYTFHTGAMITYGSDWKKSGNFIFPFMIYKVQDLSSVYGRQSEFLTGCYGFKNPLFLGITYHNGKLPLLNKNTNEAGILLGYQKPFKNTTTAFQVVYSYEFAITGLSFSTLGTHEISLLIYLDSISIFCKGNSYEAGASKCFRSKRSGYIPQI